LSFIHVVNVNHMIMFLLYQYCPLYLVNPNHIINFHSCGTISSLSFNVNHVVNFIQGSTLWSNFIHVIKFIQMVIQNLHGFHMYNLISFMAISYWHHCHPYGKKWFPVNSIQFPLFMKWTKLFSSFSPWSTAMSFLGFFVHSQSRNHP